MAVKEDLQRAVASARNEFADAYEAVYKIIRKANYERRTVNAEALPEWQVYEAAFHKLDIAIQELNSYGRIN